MKHFLSTISLNKQLEKKIFKSGSGNPIAQHKVDIEFENGLMIPLSNVVTEGEKIKVTLLVNYKNPDEGGKFPLVQFVDAEGETYDYKVSDLLLSNYNRFMAELNQLKEMIKFDYDIEYIFIRDYEEPKKHFDVFSMLVHKLEECAPDETQHLYMDITFGTVPMTLVNFMVLNYVNQCSKNIKLEAVVYSHRNHDNGEKTLFELSHMFSINSAIEKLSSVNVENPLGIVEKFLRGDSDAE